MLPKIKTAVIATTLAAAVAALPAAPALAWDSKEQNFLKGVLATLAVGALIQNSRQNNHAYRAPNYTTAPNYYRSPYGTQTYGAPVYRTPGYTYRNQGYAQPYQPGYADRSYIPSAPSGYVTPARSAFLNYSPAMRRTIQARLSDYGYYRGAIDGVWGPRTDEALRAYAADQGLGGRLGSYSGAVAVLDNLAA